MTAGVIPDVAITADVITTAADAAITVAVADGELPCLAAETAAPAFSGSSAFCSAAAITDAFYEIDLKCLEEKKKKQEAAKKHRQKGQRK